VRPGPTAGGRSRGPDGLGYPSGVPFITFEGVEGCGKSTQLAMLGARLKTAGRPVRATREPGGTPIGEKIRTILMDPAHAELDAAAEWLLIEAARRQHVLEVVAPARREGVFLLCDRFSDSTEAYQQFGRGLDAQLVAELDDIVREGLRPDLTLLYDLDPAEGLARARRRDAGLAGRFEAEDLALHERVRAAYLTIARREPERVSVIASQGNAETVFRQTWRAVAERFGL
jgi:dTMP kinase